MTDPGGLLEQDNNIELETDINFEGCTDYHHALAKAEEIVRTSRLAWHVSFSYYLFKENEDTIYPEPGDLLKIDVPDVSISGKYIKLDSVKLEDGCILAVKGAVFELEQLAWNVNDDYWPTPNPMFLNKISAPIYLEYISSQAVMLNSSGTLKWPYV